MTSQQRDRGRSRSDSGAVRDFLHLLFSSARDTIAYVGTSATEYVRVKERVRNKGRRKERKKARIKIANLAEMKMYRR